MVLVCHVISQDHVIDGWNPLLVSHYLAIFGGHSHCSNGDKMFLVVEEKDSRCS